VGGAVTAVSGAGTGTGTGVSAGTAAVTGGTATDSSACKGRKHGAYTTAHSEVNLMSLSTEIEPFSSQ
jgi:hypothetical protein